MNFEQVETIVRGWVGLDADLIWCGLVDGMYYVANIGGVLHIFDSSGTLLWHHESAPLYPDSFGPDVEDVSRWTEEAIEVIDGGFEPL